MKSELVSIISHFHGQIPKNQYYSDIQLVVVGEEGIALENLCSQIDDNDIEFDESIFNRLKAMCEMYGVSLQYLKNIEHLKRVSQTP